MTGHYAPHATRVRRGGGAVLSMRVDAISTDAAAARARTSGSGSPSGATPGYLKDCSPVAAESAVVALREAPPDFAVRRSRCHSAIAMCPEKVLSRSM
jgi:hypothetical protein